jgi:hypothetical protein
MPPYRFPCTIVSKPRSELPRGPHIVAMPRVVVAGYPPRELVTGGELFTDQVNKHDSTGKDLFGPAMKHVDQKNIDGKGHTHWTLLEISYRGAAITNFTELANMRDGDRFELVLLPDHCYFGDCCSLL